MTGTCTSLDPVYKPLRNLLIQAFAECLRLVVPRVSLLLGDRKT